MSFPPPPILHAALETVHYATVCARNWTCSTDVPHETIYDLMDAIHAVPQMVRMWEHHKHEDIITHLGCFQHLRWRQELDTKRHTIPDLVSFFEERLTEFSDGADETGLDSM